MILNSMYEAPQSLEKRDAGRCFGKLNGQGAAAVETEAMRLLDEKIDKMVDSDW